VGSLVEEAVNLPGPTICVPIVYNGRYFEAIDGLLRHAKRIRRQGQVASKNCAGFSFRARG
jgi:hypothetical protein